MKKKGIVLEIRGQYLIVMTSGGEFCKVPPVGRPVMEGEEIEFTHTIQESGISTAKRYAWRRWTYAAAACLLLLITALPLWNMVFASAYATVSIDINPSFELEVDEQYEVTDIHALNPDAEGMLSDINWKERSLIEVTRNILSEAREEGFLAKNHDVLIVPVGLKNPDAAQELIEIMKKEVPSLTAGSTDELTVTMMGSTKEMREQAQKLGVSAGRYMLYESVKNTYKDFSEDKIRSLSITDVSSKMGGFKNMPNVVQYSNPASTTKKIQPHQTGKAHPEPARPAAKPPAAKQEAAVQKKPEPKKEQTAAVRTERNNVPVKLTREEQKNKSKSVPKLITAETKYKAAVQEQKEKNKTEEDKKYNSGYGQQQQQNQQGGSTMKEEEKERNEQYKEQREKNSNNFVRPPLKKSESKTSHPKSDSSDQTTSSTEKR